MKIWLLVAILAGFMMASSALSRPAVLVTGSTDGIGVTTAKNMCAKGYDVLIHGRNQARIDKARETVEKFMENHSNENSKIVTLPAVDISTIGGCYKLVDHVKTACEKESLQLQVLMNNAGVYSEELIITEDGLEQTFAVNVLAPFIITSHLLPVLLKQPKSRIVIASSISQCRSIRDWDDMHYNKRPFSAHGSYSESKLLDAFLSTEFADRLQKAGYGTDKITCNCLDPGTVNTKMLLAGWGPCGIDVRDALDQTWLCSSDEVESVTGKYFVYQSERGSTGSYKQSERDKMWSMLTELAPEAGAMWNFDW